MTEEKPCPFCIENGQVEIIASEEYGYLIAQKQDGVVVPGRYLIVPYEHLASMAELPDEWWRTVKGLIRKLPPEARADINYSHNEGLGAGQRVPHTHGWLIQRRGEEGLPSHTFGMSKLIDIVKEQSARITELLARVKA